jgi:hypothetical protein
MSIEFRSSGSIFDALVEPPPVWLVCPVNTVPGVLGAGLALDFARRWPELRGIHAAACRTGNLAVDRVWRDVVGTPDLWVPVVLFPTKANWRRPSKLRWIEEGLEDLSYWLRDCGGPVTVVLPGLGSGLGGLRWTSVRPLIEATARECGEHRFIVYQPRG